MDAAAATDSTLAALALDGYPARHCCGKEVFPRFALRAEQLEMSGGRVPTVIWDCPNCSSKRAEPHHEAHL